MKPSREEEHDIWRTQHGLTGGRHRAFGSLLRAYIAVLRRVEEHSRRTGALPPDWYDVLLALEYAPEGRLRVGELACHVTVSRSGLTRLVDRLEEAGLVDRKIHPTDRRSFEVILTAKGREERERTWPFYAQAIAEEFGSRYSEEEAVQLADLLSRQFGGEPEAGCDGKCGG